MKTLSSEKIIKQLNVLIDEWKQQFDNPPKDFDVRFTLNTCNMLVLNNTVLCDIGNVVYDSMDYDIETLSFVDTNGFMYEIGIDWPYHKPPYISYIHKSEILYCAS